MAETWTVAAEGPAMAQVTLFNDGDAALHLDEVTVRDAAGPFFAAAIATPQTIAPGAHTPLAILFPPPPGTPGAAPWS